MPNNFFDKLNHLVKAHINDIVSPIDEQISKSRKKALARQDIRGGLEGDVKTLRARIDDALAYQDNMQAKINKLFDEKSEWDKKADKAVQDGREQDARFAIGRMQQAQREIDMLQADLTEHNYITQELISQVNMLDNVVQESAQESGDAPQETTSNRPDAEQIGQQIVSQLDNTRRKLTDLISNYTAQVTGETPDSKKHYVMGDGTPVVDEEPEPSRHPVNNRKVDDDFEARLSRLSKPDDDKK